MLDQIDWKEVSKKNCFWIGIGMVAFAVCFTLRGCFDSVARSEEARYRYRGDFMQNQPNSR
jgi:hypothetical protein